MAFGKSFTLDDKDFRKKMSTYEQKADIAIHQGITEVMLDWEKHAKILAPKEEGHLEGGIAARPDIQRKGRSLVGEIHAGTDSLSAAYALRMHESMTPAIPSGDKQFQPGTITLGKPPSEVGAAGGKYLTRPGFHFGKKWIKHIATKMKKVR